MANELQVTVGVNYTNGGLTDSVPAVKSNITQTNQEFHGPVVSVGSGAEEDLPVGDITTNGFIYLKNLDATNFVKYGPKSGGVMIEFGRIKPGEVAILRLAPGVILRWIADTAAVKVQTKHWGN